MDTKRTKGPVCGIENCRSRHYEEGEDGYLYCRNGHRREGLVRGAEDEDNQMSAARKVTRIQRDVDETATNTSKQFSGREAFELYLKCLQLILRHQIWFLVHEKGLPSELETVIFDLWALRIAQLGDRIVGDDQENGTHSQVFNTLESEDGLTTDNERGTISTLRSREKQLHTTPNMYDCLALCYIGITTLRLPLTPGDIYAWVTDGKMAYRRAIRLLPLSMKDRLPSTYRAVLDPQALMNYRVFYTTLTNLEISFEKDHGVKWPALNVEPLLLRYIKQLALPLEIYDATQRLANLLRYDFVLHCDGQHRLGIRHVPEAQLIACMIVCVKLFYPFDKVERFPSSPSEPTTIVVDWRKWHKHIAAAKKAERKGNPGFTTEELIKVQESDIFEMGADQLDQYLDFYADTFIDEAEVQRTMETDDFRNALYKMFPIKGEKQYSPIQISQGVSHELTLETIKAVHSSVETAVVVDDDLDVLRPGQLYPIWRTTEDLPRRAAVFYEEAARIAGFSLDMLVNAVFFTEARVQRWQRKQREGNRGCVD